MISVIAEKTTKVSPTEDCEGAHYRDVAVRLYKERRARDAHLPVAKGFLGEPVWDMLLDLFIAGEEGRLVSVSSASIGACTPSTTGLRRIAQLIAKGLVRRTSDPFDGRRGMLGLTEDARAAMRGYLDMIV